VEKQRAPTQKRLATRAGIRAEIYNSWKKDKTTQDSSNRRVGKSRQGGAKGYRKRNTEGMFKR